MACVAGHVHLTCFQIVDYAVSKSSRLSNVLVLSSLGIPARYYPSSKSGSSKDEKKAATSSFRIGAWEIYRNGNGNCLMQEDHSITGKFDPTALERGAKAGVASIGQLFEAFECVQLYNFCIIYVDALYILYIITTEYVEIDIRKINH